MLQEVLTVADQLRKRAIEARVLSMHTLKPIDVEAIQRAAFETRAIVTVEEHRLTGGLGSAVADVLAETQTSVCFRKYGIPDRIYHESGGQSYLRRMAGDLMQLVQSTLVHRKAA
jgi:transketolase